MTESNGIIIRPATPGDAGAYLMLVEALANYEKLRAPDAEAKTRLIEHLFGPRPFYQLILAVDHGRPIGYAAYFLAYSTFQARPTLYVEDLFVLPEYRSLKVGHRLLGCVANLALAEGCGRLDLLVLDWNKLALDFYVRHGVKAERQWVLHRAEGDEIRRVAESSAPEG